MQLNQGPPGQAQDKKHPPAAGLTTVPERLRVITYIQAQCESTVKAITYVL